MAGLSRSLQLVKGYYDVIVVGSGYGGGVAASRLARAGKRVAVLERGREVLAGGFPSRFPDLKNELQVTGKRLRTGPSSALFDVRLGEDMHVLVGCGLGGGSLVNAGVALRPDDRVFADPVWPGQIAQDGLIEEGFRRAERFARGLDGLPRLLPRFGDGVDIGRAKRDPFLCAAWGTSYGNKLLRAGRLHSHIQARHFGVRE